MINSFDIDGVINMGDYVGLRPNPEDVIITGRSMLDEHEYTKQWLESIGITNRLFMNPVPYTLKTRKSSGEFKARMLNHLLDSGEKIGLHFEDDPVQAKIIKKLCPRVKVVEIRHDLVEKENVWHGPINDQPGSTTNA